MPIIRVFQPICSVDPCSAYKSSFKITTKNPDIISPHPGYPLQKNAPPKNTKARFPKLPPRPMQCSQHFHLENQVQDHLKFHSSQFMQNGKICGGDIYIYMIVHIHACMYDIYIYHIYIYVISYSGTLNNKILIECLVKHPFLV